MEPTHQSTDELLEELQRALLRVQELEGLLVDRVNDTAHLKYEGIGQEPRHDEFAGSESFEATKTLDLTSLFCQDVTSSGSYYTKGIRTTLFGRLLEALPIPALLVSGSRDVVFANRAWARTSISCENVVGKRFASLFPASSVAEDFDALAESVFAARKVLSREAVLAVEDHMMWARLTIRSVRLGPDRLLLVLIEDLSSQKQELLQKQKYQDSLKQEIERRKGVERDLRESQQRLELALKGAELSFWDWNVRTGLLILDKCFVAALGYSADEIGPHKEFWESLIHADDQFRFQAEFKSHFAGASSFLECEHRVRTKTGQWKWILTRGKVLLRNEQGEPLRALGTNLDVTERKQLEQRSQLLTHAMIQAVDRERDRISLDLHDLVAQDLVVLKLRLDTMLDGYADVYSGLRSRMSQASDRLLQLLKAVREISYHLRPAGLDKLGLVSTVGEYCREFEDRNQISVQFTASGMENLKLDFDTEINLFRIVQESLNNVRKHASANNVTLRLTGSKRQITLTIKDDGCGFDMDKSVTRDSTSQQVGLWSMEQRVAILHGKLAVRTRPNEGTEILIEVPNQEEKHAQEGNLDCR